MTAPDLYGIIHIEIKEVERVEINLGEGSDFQGYLIVGEKLKPLPIGSTLDRKPGVFTWQPGPGFIKTYDLVFFKKDRSGVPQKITVKITIVPHN